MKREPTPYEVGWREGVCTTCGWTIGGDIPKVSQSEWNESHATPKPTPAPTPAPAPAPTVAPETLSEKTKDTVSALGSANVEDLFTQGSVTLSDHTTLEFEQIEVVAASTPVPAETEKPVPGATPAPENGKLVVQAASIDTSAAGGSDAYAAFAVAWEENGHIVSPEGTVRVSIPVTVGGSGGGLSVPTGKFKLVRVDSDGESQILVEVAFTYVDGVLTFDMDHTAVYMLIPA